MLGAWVAHLVVALVVLVVVSTAIALVTSRAGGRPAVNTEV